MMLVLKKNSLITLNSSKSLHHAKDTMPNSTITIGKFAGGAVGGSYNNSGIGITGSYGSIGGFNIGDLSINSNRLDHMFDNSELTFSIIKANGGYVIRCGSNSSVITSVYIIPDTKKNFDRELGKIISMHLLKA